MPRIVRVHARWDDADRFGHVNNAAYLALIRDATDRELPSPLELAEIEIEFKQPVPPDADVDIEMDREGDHVVRYRLARGDVIHAIARAAWRSSEAAAPPLPAIDRDAGGRLFSHTHTVRSYEIDPRGALRPSAPLQWFEYAVYRAADLAAWPATRMIEADFVTLQIGHRLVLGAHPTVGEDLAITSRIVEMRRVSGMWHHEARRD